MTRAPLGMTLLELILTLALMAILASVVGLTLRAPAPVREVDTVSSGIAQARAESIGTGRSVSLSIVRDGRLHSVTALPDGRVFADSTLGVDLLTGGPPDAAP